MFKWLANCMQISRMLSEGMDRQLSVLDRLRIRMHLLMCTGCTNFERQLRVLRTAARSLVEHSPRDGLAPRGTEEPGGR